MLNNNNNKNNNNNDISEFKYLGCVFEESGTDGVECSRKVANGRRVADDLVLSGKSEDLRVF